MDGRRTLRLSVSLALACAAALALAPAAATAQDWYDSFEDYDADLQVAGQGIWQTWSGGTGTAEDAYVSEEQAATGVNSLKIVGPNDTVAYFQDLTGGLWIVKAKVYVPAGMSGTLYFIMLNRYSTACGGGCDWSVQVPMNAGAGTIHDDMGGATLPLIVDEWVEIRVEIDLNNNLHSIFYNGDPLALSRVWDDGGNNAIQAIDLYSGDCSGAYYDDVSLERLCVPVQVNREVDLNSTALIEGVDTPVYEEGDPMAVALVLTNIREDDPDCQELGDVTITEKLPEGWKATDISDGGTFKDGVITWVIPATSLKEDELTYQASGPVVFATVSIVGTVEEKGNKNFTHVVGAAIPTTGGGLLPDGAIAHWLILGPYVQSVVAAGSAGTADQLEQDFLTDGDEIYEDSVLPQEGDQVETDYGAASAAVRLAGPGEGASRADLNPDGIPTWFVWRDLDSMVSYDNTNMWGGNVDTAMAYAACYLDVRKDIEAVYFACGSDDAIQLLLDGQGIWTNPVRRGWPGFVDVVGPFDLDKGIHILMTKVFEDGGGWNFGVRIQDESGKPFAPSDIIIRLAPPPSVKIRRTLSILTYKPGDMVTATLRLSEVAAPPPAAVKITETLPAGWTATSASDGGTIQGRTIVWNLTGAAIANDKALTYQLGAAPKGITAVFKGAYEVEGLRFRIDATTLKRDPIPKDDLCAWIEADIGNPPAGGQEKVAADSFNIWGGGEDITARADSFRFIHQPSPGGDLTMSVRVEAQEGTGPNAKAGLMVRQSLEPGSLFYFVQATPSDGAGPRWRSTLNGNATPVLPISDKVELPVWLKLVKTGNTFTAFTSADGVTWEQNFRTTTHKNPRTLNLTDPVLVGFAVTAGVADQPSGVMFREFRCEGPGCPANTGCVDNARFIRGDTDGTGNFTIGDGIQILMRQFGGLQSYLSNCEETGDVDGNGQLTIGDAVWLFNYMFVGGPAPAPPSPTCGDVAKENLKLGCEAGVVEICK